MDKLDVMRLFVRVVETASFSKAAKAEGIGQPTVSKQVSALEARLGAQLLRRTSRGLSLTSAGEDFYEAAVRLLNDLDAAESRIGRGQVSPSGRIRVATSPAFGRMYIIPKLREFFDLYPDISVDLEISDRHVNLIEESIDVAIRIGNLADSALVARRIGSIEMATVASAAYVARRGIPMVPEDIERHDCVNFMFHGAPRPWEFKTPSGPVTYIPQGRVRSNDAEHIRAAVLSGLGIGHNASWLFASEIASGEVVHLLQDFVPPAYPIHAVSPGRRMSSKVKVLVEFLADVFAQDPYLKIR
jgi:LysR family transcriptional regulator for bpeEF and oprC